MKKTPHRNAAVKLTRETIRPLTEGALRDAVGGTSRRNTEFPPNPC